MEPTERRILALLERAARTPPADIAAMLGVDEAQVRRVIRDCEQKKIIRRYKTIVDWDKTGDQSVLAFIDVRVSPAREVGFDDVAARIYGYPEVLAVNL